MSGRHAAPGPADRVPITPAAIPGNSSAPWESTEVLPAVSPHRAARKKLANYAGKAAVVASVALVASIGIVNADVSDASEQAAPAASNLAYLDLRSESLSSRGTDRDVINEDRVVVSIEADGETIEQSLGGGTVGDVLAAAGIVVGPDDIVSEQLNSPLVDGQQITIQRVDGDIVTEEIVDAHESTTVKSDSLYKGEKKVTTAGVDGHAVHTYRVVRVDGEEVSREVLAEVVTQERVDEVITVGTKERPRAVAASTNSSSSGATSSGPVMSGSNREIGQTLAANRGWTGEQWTCLDALWKRESNWNHLAQNRSSGAYGIPQALPGSKMGSVASDWRTNPATQITWGLNYISGRYGTPCGAWSHSQSRGWY